MPVVGEFCEVFTGARAIVSLLLVMLFLLYHIRRQTTRPLISLLLLLVLGIMRLLIISAFGEILRQWDAKVGASPPLSSTHYGLQRHQDAKVGKWSAAVGKSAYGLVPHLAGVIMLLDVGEAVTEEQGEYGMRYARQSRQKPPQTRILCAPNPTGEKNGQAPPSDSTSVPMRRTIIHNLSRLC